MASIVCLLTFWVVTLARAQFVNVPGHKIVLVIGPHHCPYGTHLGHIFVQMCSRWRRTPCFFPPIFWTPKPSRTRGKIQQKFSKSTPPPSLHPSHLFATQQNKNKPGKLLYTINTTKRQRRSHALRQRRLWQSLPRDLRGPHPPRRGGEHPWGQRS